MVLKTKNVRTTYRMAGNFLGGGGGGGGWRLVFMGSQGKPSELIFAILNFMIATQSRGAVLCDIMNMCSQSR